MPTPQYDDICENDNGYFIGSIICIDNSSDAFQTKELEVVDGQQRLTTLCLLLTAIYNRLKIHKDELDEHNRNMGAYMRKMALSGYVLHVDLSPVRELVSLQRRCSNNLNQVAIQANTYGAIYPEELAALQRDY